MMSLVKMGGIIGALAATLTSSQPAKSSVPNDTVPHVGLSAEPNSVVHCGLVFRSIIDIADDELGPLEGPDFATLTTAEIRFRLIAVLIDGREMDITSAFRDDKDIQFKVRRARGSKSVAGKMHLGELDGAPVVVYRPKRGSRFDRAVEFTLRVRCPSRRTPYTSSFLLAVPSDR